MKKFRNKLKKNRKKLLILDKSKFKVFNNNLLYNKKFKN